MLLSRRVSVLLLGALVLVVVALVGIMGVLRAVSASQDTAADAKEARSTTLTVLTKTREQEVVDLGPRGPSQGDLRVVNAPLYNASGKQRIGRLDVFCVTTDPADKPDEKVNMTECTYTYTLQGGEISVQGATGIPKLSEPPPRAIEAITGGTDKYAGVRGEVRYERRGNKVINTFHFID